MARPILCSQEDLYAVDMQDITSERHNTLPQGVRDAGPLKRITIGNDNNNAKDAEPPYKRKKIREGNGNNNAKEEEKEAAEAEERVEDVDDDDDSDDNGDDDNDSEEREGEDSGDSDLESSSDEEDSISFDNGYYSNGLRKYTYIDYPDSQDLWQSEDNRENDYGFV